MTIRAKLYVAILLTVIGPVVTIAVALHGMDRLGDRFDEVQDRADRRALALDLKFGVTDFNGWQTAYGYDDGASRPRFTRLGQGVSGPTSRWHAGSSPTAMRPGCYARSACASTASWSSTTSRTRRFSGVTTRL